MVYWNVNVVFLKWYNLCMSDIFSKLVSSNNIKSEEIINKSEFLVFKEEWITNIFILKRFLYVILSLRMFSLIQNKNLTIFYLG